MQVNILMVTNQVIHCQVKDKGSQFECCITFVYDKNKLHERKKLWDQLRMIYNTMQESWLVIGDFNSVLSVNDRINGQPIHQNEIVDFQNCIKDIGVGQLNRKWCQWSWCNKRDAGERIYNNNDWVFGNTSWFTKHSSFEAVYEVPGVSDHSPIEINTEVVRSYLKKPFRLYNVLLYQKEFQESVQEIWNQRIEGHTMHSIWTKLQRMQDRERLMNKEMKSLEKKV
ncbi:uncharacterized protein LOC142178417 [Nicotiana tabacum]|uniref:Uncharacterized protein LOC142178417 n=1 Tax=Nicotiana tabacum TaxID=4097 RepID=A0AC58U356_TOBAC